MPGSDQCRPELPLPTVRFAPNPPPALHLLARGLHWKQEAEIHRQPHESGGQRC